MSFDIYLSPPDVGELEREFILDALDSGWVAPLGPHVEALEEELSDFVGGAHVVALSSGSAALHLALVVAGVQPGDEVVCSTLTFAASAFAIVHAGGIPIFIDSESDSWNMDPDLLRDFLTKRARIGKLPKAVMVVDLYGETANYPVLLAVANEFDIPIVEDAAEALGATCAGQAAGTFGLCGAFSFNGNKIITTSGGGAFISHDEHLAKRVRFLATQAREPVPWYEHHQVGYNYRMSNLLAAVGRAQLQRLPAMVLIRKQHQADYRTQLASVGVKVKVDAPWGQGNAWLTTARFQTRDLREEVRRALAEDGIESRHIWKPMHQQPVFSGLTSIVNGTSDDIFESGLCLPSGASLTGTQLNRVVSVVSQVVDGSS